MKKDLTGKKFGRLTVHHWNEKRDDNRSENLELFATRGEHTSYHAQLRKRRRIAKQCLGA